MPTLRSTKIAVLILTALLSYSTAHAQFPEAGEVFLSFAPNARLSTRNVAPGVPFDLHFLVQVADPDTLSGDLAGIEGGVELGQVLTLLDQEWAGVGLNIGPFFDSGGLNVYNFIVGIGECIPLGPTPTWVGKITLILTADVSDHVLSIGAPHVDSATPSSFNGIGAGYANCANELVLFSTTTQGSSVVLNASSVPVASSSWSTLKSRFGTAGR